MKKMKKVLALAMTAAMTASLMTGLSATTASAKGEERTKITALLKGTESTEQFKTFDYLLIIPGLFEPPVRTLRATIPENGSHIFR